MVTWFYPVRFPARPRIPLWLHKYGNFCCYAGPEPTIPSFFAFLEAKQQWLATRFLAFDPVADSLLTVINESKESAMNSRIKIVKRNEISEPNQITTNSKPTELVRNREMVSVVKSWIDEFKLRSKQESRVTLPLLNKA